MLYLPTDITTKSEIIRLLRMFNYACHRHYSVLQIWKLVVYHCAWLTIFRHWPRSSACCSSALCVPPSLYTRPTSFYFSVKNYLLQIASLSSGDKPKELFNSLITHGIQLLLEIQFFQGPFFIHDFASFFCKHTFQKSQSFSNCHLHDSSFSTMLGA